MCVRACACACVCVCVCVLTEKMDSLVVITAAQIVENKETKKKEGDCWRESEGDAVLRVEQNQSAQIED